MTNSICSLFKIKYPIISGGMIWVSGGNLAAAVSNAGGLGLIGAGSMKPELLKEQILKAQAKTKLPFGVNVPLLYEKAEEQLNTALDLGVKIFFTSAGSPNKYTAYLKNKGAIVVHVTSSPELALKCANAGVDAVVVEGFEAGGHNGREEITTMALIPQVKKILNIPIIAAGGIASGAGILAAMALGADGVQMGTRFLMTKESSAHADFKNLILNANSASTKLMMKPTVPVRLLKNKFADEIEQIEKTYAGEQLILQLQTHLGKGRAKKGMHDGDLLEGELEVGQICSLIKDIPSCEQLIKDLMDEFHEAQKKISLISF